MNKAEFQKYLDTLNEEELKEQLVVLFEKIQPVRDYYGFRGKVFDPKKMERYRNKIIEALHPDQWMQGGLNIDGVENALLSFRQLDPDEKYIVELYCFAIREASDLANEYGGDFGDEFYIYFEELFENLLQRLFQKGLLEEFKAPIEDVVGGATDAFGHQDSLRDTFTEFFK